MPLAETSPIPSELSEFHPPRVSRPECLSDLVSKNGHNTGGASHHEFGRFWQFFAAAGHGFGTVIDLIVAHLFENLSTALVAGWESL